MQNPIAQFQEDAFWTSIVNFIFLAVAAVLLLPLGHGALVLRLLAGY